MSYSFLSAHHFEPSVLESTPFNRPTKGDWDRHRELLTQLWSVENKKLSEVMAIMEQHGHIATGRMYKHHFSKWKLDKKFKERDAVAILEKKRQRDADGKETEIILRGKTIKMEDVDRYLKRRKGVPLSYGSRASTPSDVACKTPPPMATFQDMDDTQLDQYNTWTNMHHEPADYGFLDVSGSSMDKPMIQRSSLNGNFLPCHSRISRSPSPPQPFVVPEHLFSSIKSYLHGSFDSGTWVEDDTGSLTTLNPTARTTSQYPEDFHMYCFMAVDLLNKGSIVEFRRMLSKAFSVIQDLLLAQRPNTLDCFLDVFVLLIRSNKVEIASVLRTYLSQMATRILPKDHPWYQICQAFGMLDVESFEEVIIQSWKCAIDTWEECLGSFHAISLANRVDFISRLYGSKDLLEEEMMLRKLLVQVEQQTPSVSPRLVHRAMVTLGLNVLDQRKYIEAQKIGQAIISLAERDKESIFVEDKIYALEIVARCQYHQDKNGLAEMNLREVIRLASERRGMKDSWAIDIMVLLEGWLREWGREEEAEELKVQRESLLKFDEMDEELARVTI
ncbi:hypothetical protein BKA61DRAFT_172799 [Leptodontidium sp. MPI-SDFR-AT-0119]|nr:hypothetical protein BKA61DRAFT_172799 [Leptodontidium sp. MPI-SDFR-AT-0119]